MKQPARTRAGIADRRRLAVERVTAGRTPVDVADFPGLNVETGRRWVRSHRAAEVLGWLTRRLTLVRLPPYSPDPNLVEAGWG